ncbi:uncharacterized protein C15orf39 homolog [Protopterus annectens]|uniref:uncharacterized protein C15orf39 homolog n=1 Tax=Protopterus annectens TaxID=7888 RepID=UPI001CFB2499|nr:uncharacterized protein C15orf39 homolog [Protopterus annectens]XP_043933176.1 uncharacterized protein C15orf39 homolog [Protopterus annectens]
MMASKRQLDYVDTLAYTKVPRLEKETENMLSAHLYKPSLLARYSKESPLNYSGTYLTYPLNNLDSESPQLSTEWNPFAAYVQHTHNPVSQRVSLKQHPNSSFLYRPDTLTPNQDFQHSVTEKGISSLIRNVKNVADNWGNFAEHQGLLKQHKPSTDVMNSGPTLKPDTANTALQLQTSSHHKIAVPKPVYGNCICSESGCNSKSCLSISNNPSVRSQKVAWNAPSSVAARPMFVSEVQQSINQHCGATPALAKNTLCDRLLQHTRGEGLHSKDSGRGTLACASLQYDKFAAVQVPSPERGYSQLHNGSPKNIPSPLVEPHKLSAHPVTVGSQMMPHKSLCQEKLPVSRHVIPSQMYTCPAGSPVPSKDCNNFSPMQSAGSRGLSLKEDPKLTAYLEQQRSQNHLMRSSDSCMYQASLPLPSSMHVPVVEAGLQKKDSTLPNQSGYKLDLLLQPPGYTFSSPEFPACRPLILYDTHSNLSVDCSVPKVQGGSPTKNGGSAVQVNSSHSAFQPVHSERNMSAGSDKQINTLREELDARSRFFRQACTRSELPTVSEMECRKIKKQEVYIPEVGKQSQILEESHSKARHKQSDSVIPIIISDSPEKKEINCEKRVKMMQPLLVSNSIASQLRVDCLSTDGKSVPLHHLEGQKSYSPPSPPMPVINNVFSLAPYRSYLEKACLASSPKQTEQKADGECSAIRTRGSVEIEKTEYSPDRSSRLPKDNIIQTQETYCSKDCHSNSSKRMEKLWQEESGTKAAQGTTNERNDTGEELHALNYSLKNVRSGVFHESCDMSAKTSSGKVTELDQDRILDLSLKKTVDKTVKNIASMKGCSNQEENVMIKQTEHNTACNDDKLEKPEKLDNLKEVHQSLPFINSPDKTNFQSSASFLFKKFKILKSAAAKVAEIPPELKKTIEDPRVELCAQENSPALKLTSGNNKFAVKQNISQGLKFSGTLVLPGIAAAVPLLPAISNSSAAHVESSTGLPGSHTSEHKASSRSFLHMHQTLCSIVSKSVLQTSPDVLKDWLQKLEAETKTKARVKLSKHKNGSDVLEAVDTTKGKDVWLHGNVQSFLKNVLSQLDSYMFLKTCPFPHVIRAGTVFIPIYVVKQKLFPSIPAVQIDQVLQEYKVELRPTTLSEEKQLTDLQLKSCPSKLKKLLSLKQLPVIYPDLLNLYWCDCAKNRLGKQSEHVVATGPFSSDPESKPEAASKHLESIVEGNVNAVNTIKQEEIRVKRKRGKRKSVAQSSQKSKEPLRFRSKLLCKGKTKDVSETVTSCDGTDVISKNEKLSQFCEKLPEVKPDNILKAQSETDHKFALEKSSGSLVLKLKRVPVKSSVHRKRSTHDKQPAPGIKLKLVNMMPQSSEGNFKCSYDSEDCSQLNLKVTQVTPKKKKKIHDNFRLTRSPSKVLHLRRSVVSIKFHRLHDRTQKATFCHTGVAAKRKATLLKPKFLLNRTLQHSSTSRECIPRKEYPELVGKQICHLYEENDKSESWYRGVVVRIHEKHPNPLKTVYEVRYDTEPEWLYYLELLQDYEKGWLKVDE